MDNFPKIPGYKIKKIIGEGGMSIVYLAIQENLKRKVAIKVMHPHRMKDAQAARRFLKEAETASKLNHSNIVSIIDFGEADNIYYLAMEYLPSSLASKIKLSPKRRIPPSDALNIMGQVADALDYAHSQGIIHRDIKSENILFRKNGTPVVVDFGIARTINSTTRLTRTGISIGTIHYMSPEQCRAETLDGRSDLYSLGIVLYEMLTGHVPYDAKNEAGVLLKHLQESIPSLPEPLAPLQPIINKLLGKNREDRIQRGRDLVRLIANLQNGTHEGSDDDDNLDGLSMPTVEIPHLPQQTNRKRLFIASVITASLIALGVAAYFAIPILFPTQNPPIIIPTKQPTGPPVEEKKESPNIKENDIAEAEYNTLLTQAKNLIQTGRYQLAAEALDQARRIKSDNQLTAIQTELETKQAQANQQAVLEAARKKAERKYNELFLEAGKMLDNNNFQDALERIARARALKNTQELTDLEHNVKTRQREAEREALLKKNPPKTVNIFAISSELQKKYNEELKRIEIQGPPTGTWVSGQVSISLTVKATGVIQVEKFLDKWLTIKPDTNRDKIKESIMSSIASIGLSPPVSKDGDPVSIQSWRMNFKVETFQGKIILDLQ